MKHLQSINELFGIDFHTNVKKSSGIAYQIKKALNEKFPGKITDFYYIKDFSDIDFNQDTGVKRTCCRFEYEISPESKWIKDPSIYQHGKIKHPREYLDLGFSIKEFDDEDYIVLDYYKRGTDSDSDNMNIKCNNITEVTRILIKFIRNLLTEKERQKLEWSNEYRLKQLQEMPKRREEERKFNTDSSKLLGREEEPKEIETTKSPSKLGQNLKKFLD